MGADKSLARPTSRCILFDGENISFDASLSIVLTFLQLKTKLRGLSPRANYTDRAAAAGRRS